MEINRSYEENRLMQEVMMLAGVLKDNESLHKFTVYMDRNYHFTGIIEKVTKVKHARFLIQVLFKVVFEQENRLEVEVKLKVNFKYREKIELNKGIVKISKVKIYIVQIAGERELQFMDTKNTQVCSAVPDVIDQCRGDRKSKIRMSTPKSRKISIFCLENTNVAFPLWQVLVIDLSRFIIRTGEEIKFEMKELVKIADPVRFTGIVLESEVIDSSFGKNFRFLVRDMLTNDSLRLYVSFPRGDSKYYKYLETIENFDVIHATASRLISQSLAIYCKINLNKNMSNLTVEKKHKDCRFSSCLCTLNNNLINSQNFAPFNLLVQIEPWKLFRVMIKVQLRVSSVSLMFLTPKCLSCSALVAKKIEKCCENQHVSNDLAIIFIGDDSSGIAECQLNGLDNMISLLELNENVILDLRKIIEGGYESVIRYNSFPESFKRLLNNNGPILKSCCVRPQGKTQGRRSSVMFRDAIMGKGKDQLVKLNSERDGVCLHLKVLKVYD